MAYLRYEDESQHTSGGSGYDKPIHCSIHIDVVPIQKVDKHHDKGEDGRDVQNGRNLLGIVEPLDLDFPDVEGEKGSNSLQQDFVDDVHREPDVLRVRETSLHLVSHSDSLFLESKKSTIEHISHKDSRLQRKKRTASIHQTTSSVDHFTSAHS